MLLGLAGCVDSGGVFLHFCFKWNSTYFVCFANWGGEFAELFDQTQTDRTYRPPFFHTDHRQTNRQTDHKNQCGKNAGFRREMVGETENYRLYILIPFLYLSFIFPVFPYQNPQKIIYIFIEILIKLDSLKDFKKIYPLDLHLVKFRS